MTPRESIEAVRSCDTLPMERRLEESSRSGLRRLCISFLLLVVGCLGLVRCADAQTGRVRLNRRHKPQTQVSSSYWDPARPRLLEVALGGGGGDQPPLQGAAVYMFAVGMNGLNGGQVSLLDTTNVGAVNTNPSNHFGYVLTDSYGNFTLTGLYSMNCLPSPAQQQIYFVAFGGSPDGSITSPNTFSAEVAAIPVTCSQLASLGNKIYIEVSEATTVAAALALASFADTADDGFSATQSSANALATAFMYANSLATSALISGDPYALGAPVQNPYTQYTVATIANILASCQNTDDSPVGVLSSACSSLSSAATGGAFVPADIWQAALAIAENPTNNVANLFHLASTGTPFQPSFSSVPSTFAVGPCSAPTITALSLGSGPTSLLTISGTYLSMADSVVIGGQLASNTSYAPASGANAGFLTVAIPSGTASGAIVQVFLQSQGSNPVSIGADVLLALTTLSSASSISNTATLIATVSPALTSANTPTGIVSFYDGTNLLGSANISGSTASFSSGSMSVGTHKITALYSGDTKFSPGSAVAIYQVPSNGGVCLVQ